MFFHRKKNIISDILKLSANDKEDQIGLLSIRCNSETRIQSTHALATTDKDPMLNGHRPPEGGRR